ncbi:hypothetical protein [Luteolibacter sp. Populi]|uniref:hypothetical protein n=1 Tax=Luteolibacter sp. Populi TaxID=3230487 RepID=UPI00346538F2
MIRILPAALALLGVGMFALSLWLQDRGRLPSATQELVLRRPPSLVESPAASEPARRDEATPVSIDLPR